jgi:hypothetical protein
MVAHCYAPLKLIIRAVNWSYLLYIWYCKLVCGNIVLSWILLHYWRPYVCADWSVLAGEHLRHLHAF